MCTKVEETTVNFFAIIKTGLIIKLVFIISKNLKNYAKLNNYYFQAVP